MIEDRVFLECLLFYANIDQIFEDSFHFTYCAFQYNGCSRGLGGTGDCGYVCRCSFRFLESFFESESIK